MNTMDDNITDGQSLLQGIEFLFNTIESNLESTRLLTYECIGKSDDDVRDALHEGVIALTCATQENFEQVKKAVKRLASLATGESK